MSRYPYTPLWAALCLKSQEYVKYIWLLNLPTQLENPPEMRCKGLVDWVHFQLLKHSLGKWIHSIIPGVKPRLNFQRFSSLPKKQTLCQAHWRGKQQNISCILSVFLLSVNFSFVSARPEGAQKWRRVRRRREKGGREARGGVVVRGDVFFTCSHQMHMENYSTSKDCRIPSRPQQRKNDRLYIYISISTVYLSVYMCVCASF